ncbi:MAG: DUF6691 family protein [Pseudomonadota bacterium]|nr:DUF6691 family protein [Pseudomonadota bacterium]
MKTYASAFGIGLLFGLGLCISGMANPAVVLGFLDIFGQWNPALLIVMVAALAVGIPGFRLVKGRRPLFAGEMHIPTRRDLDAPLIAGAIIFGVGWGLAGICPGPAIVLAGVEPLPAFVFLATMTAGLSIAAVLRDWLNAHG